MKIAFDAKRMLNNPTGLGNHARILLNALMRDYPENNYLLFTPKARDEFFNQLQGGFEVRFPETQWAKTLHPLWRSYGITHNLVKNRADVYHGISNELPMNIHRTHIPTAVTIHDLIFLKHTDQYPWLDRQVYTAKTKYAAKHAGAIIAVSEETKRDLTERYSVPEKKITVIYPSVDPAFYNTAANEQKTAVARQYNLPEKYILNVGSFFSRKNQLKLIEAFDKIKNQIQENLVLVGSSGNMLNVVRQFINQKKLGQRVHIITNAANADLPVIYQAASVFVFPSRFEGFGAPVLEALFSGTPVIATRGGAIAEAAGTGSLFISSDNAAEMAENILSVLSNEQLRNKMISNGRLHAQTMTDKVFAAKTIEVYNSIL